LGQIRAPAHPTNPLHTFYSPALAAHFPYFTSRPILTFPLLSPRHDTALLTCGSLLSAHPSPRRDLLAPTCLPHLQPLRTWTRRCVTVGGPWIPELSSPPCKSLGATEPAAAALVVVSGRELRCGCRSWPNPASRTPSLCSQRRAETEIRRIRARQEPIPAVFLIRADSACAPGLPPL
jgi:hypothetical protein